MSGDREKALSLGCTGYIEKPIDPDKIIAQIKEYL
jgi:CheY-like chemotaxis protein